jgi:hypothetical protein
LTTSFAAAPSDLYGLWRAVLRGARGLVLWDEDNSIVREDGSPGPRGEAYAPIFAALRGAVGRHMIDTEPIYDPVSILYSPVSFRVRWMLDHRPAGDAWMQRSSESELEDNAWRVSLRGYAAALARMGLRPKYITPGDLVNGSPREGTLILPHAIAMSDRELQAITAFTAKGGRVIADTPPGQFDGHARRRETPSLPVTIVSPDDLARTLPIAPAFRIEAPHNDIDTYLYRSHGKRLLALQRRTAGETSETVTVDLNGWHARDIASGQDYGRPKRLDVTIGPVTPVFLEVER